MFHALKIAGGNYLEKVGHVPSSVLLDDSSS